MITRYKVAVASILICLFSIHQPVLGICGDGWIQSGLYCYYFSTVNASQPDAQLICEQDDANLANFDDDGENTFCYNNGPMLDDDSYWIGYEHIFGSIWRWPTTGKSGSFQKWDIGEPDGEGKCTRMTPYVQGIWRDWDCDRKLKFICKKYADCGEPETMPGATYVTVPEGKGVNASKVYPLGAVATYTCDDGNEYMDESLAKPTVCAIGGSWEPDLVNTDACEPKQCSAPPEYNEHMITNGTETDRAFGVVISYECESGYWFNQFELGVTKHLTCALDKKWRGDRVEECTQVYCVRPVTSNARADTPLNSFGVVATYTCEYGFEYADNDTVKSFECGSNGWIPPPVECIELQCPEMDVDGAWNSTGDRGVGTKVEWTCDDGMRYPDTTTRKHTTCQEEQYWWPRITDSCERKRCLGIPPNATDTFTHDWNGTLYVYRFEDEVIYTCIDGWFFSDGLTTRAAVCNMDGEWTPRIITDCLGEIVEVKHGVTHKPIEVEGAATFGSITMIALGIFVAAIVFFDAVTFGKHIGKLKENLNCHKSGESAGEESSEPAPEMSEV